MWVPSHGEVDAFLTQQRPKQVDEAFAEVAAGESAELQRQVVKLGGEIWEDAAENALTETGKHIEYRNLKLVQEYYADRASSVEVSETRKAEVVNHLYSFFCRYYEHGDFIPRRRYGAHETYAVPYNSEEVFLRTRYRRLDIAGGTL